MANNEIKATVVLTESGMAEIDKKGKSINKQLTDITTNSKAANKALNQSRSKVPYQETVEYGEARAAGGTGAAGRDFAKQARGLGGLVHVYATFAANIFAVTAAFTALDKAYSVIRLEQSADIMSNKIGFSVKNLSKDLIEATGHAISFQEALQFSNIGISAGLTAKQITNLTVIAKGAANALGRDMGDAVRRIVQGTAKQEQEILDELGIFVRAKTAYAEYAKKIGAEGPDALTAQQRVQAYAEQVAIAGEKWKEFAKVEDPFSKFTAKLHESGTELLNIINSIVTPILDLLSNSRHAIEAILVTMTTALLSRALPGMKTGLSSMFTLDKDAIAREAELSKKILLNKNEETLKARNEELKKSFQTERDLDDILEKDRVALSKKIIQRDVLLKSYDAETERLKLNSALSKVDTDLSSKLGINTKILSANITNPMANIDLKNQESINKVIESTVRQQILNGNEKTRQLKLQEAIKRGLLDEKSTLDNIITTEKARASITSAIAEKHSLRLAADAKAMNFSVKLNQLDLEIDKRQNLLAADELLLAEETNGVLDNRKRIEQEINDLIEKRKILERAEKAYIGSKEQKSYQAREKFSDVVMNTNTALMGASTFGAKWEVIKNLPKEIWKTVEEAEGATNKVKNFTRGVMFAGTLAVRGLLSAVNAVMMGMLAWELVIRPLGYAFGIFSEAQDKINESTKRLKESSDAATSSIAKVNKEIEKGLDAAGLMQAYQLKINALKSVQDSMGKVEEDIRAKILLDKEKRESGGYFQRKRREEQALKSGKVIATSQEAATGMAVLESNKDYVSAAAAKTLTNALHDLNKAESENSGTYLSASQREEKRANALSKVQEALGLVNAEYERHLIILNKVVEPGKEALRSLDDLEKHYKEKLDSMLNFGTAEGQNAYSKLRSQAEAVFAIDPSQATDKLAATQSMMLDATEVITRLYGETDLAAAKMSEFWAAFQSGDIEKLKKFYELGIKQYEGKFKTGSGGDTLLQTKLGLAQEELKLQNLRNQQEEKTLGFIKEETLQKTYEKELNVAAAEFTKEMDKKSKAEQELIQKRYGIRKEELRISHEQRIQQAALNKLKVEEIEPAKNALEIAKAEYNYKKATIGTSALEDIKQEAEQRRKEFILRQAEIFKLAGIEKTRAQATLDKDKEIAGISEQTSIIELQKKERQEALNLSLDAYIARQDELIKGEDKLAIYDKLNLNFADIKKAQIDEELSNINKINDINLKLLKTTQLKVNAEKAISDEKKRQHEIDKRKLEEALGTKDYQKVLDEVGGWSTIMFNEAHKRTGDFKDSMRNVITGAFDGLYAGIDTAIDNLTTKWMKSQKISLKDIVLDFRNAAAEEFRKMAADQMKLSARKAVETIILASTGKDIKQKDIPKAQLDYLKSIDETLKKLLKEQQAPTILTTDTMQTEQSIFGKIYSNNQNTANPETTVEGVKTDKTSETIRKIDTEGSSVFNTIFEGIKTQISSIFGDSGILSAGFDLLKNALTSLFSSNSSNTASSTGSTGDFLSKGVQLASTAWDWAGNLFPFENGGIMSQYGALKLNKYANGGIATGPQLALFGEGKRNEAYVPLPDGRSIPVTMNTPTTSQSGNSGPISVSITINTNTGQTDTQVNGKGNRVNAMAEFGALISQKVKEEIINQSRPNGLLNR